MPDLALSSPTDLTEPNRSWTARDRQQWLFERFFATGEWANLSTEARKDIRDKHRELYGIGETAAMQDFKVASMLADHLSGDYSTAIRIHQSRLDRESATAAEPRDRIAASKAALQSFGALNPKGREEDLSQLNDKQVRHRLVQSIARPDKQMRVILREAVANPGPHLVEILNEWLSANSTETEGEEI